jgi:hypothetical protein
VGERSRRRLLPANRKGEPPLGAAQAPVAQIFNLLYRGFSIRSLPNSAGLRPGDRSAEYNSAVQQSATPRYEVAAGHPAGKFVAACNDSGEGR